LLGFRLARHLSVANSQFDVPEFTSDARATARVLGATLEGSANLQQELTNVLRRQDEANRAEKSQTPAAVVLEVVLTLCHSNSLNEYVGEIAQLANALFETRGEDIRLSPRTVGDVLRRELGLVGRRRALGYQLVLDVAVQRRLHRLGMSHGVLQRVAGCPRCQEMPVANAI
jgi:hypothetical protein